MIFENACNPLTITPVYNFRSVNDISLFQPLMINDSVKILFCPVHPDIRKIITLKVPRPIGLTTIVFRWCVWYWWNDDRKTEVLGDKTVPIRPPQISPRRPVSNLRLHVEWLARNSVNRFKGWRINKNKNCIQHTPICEGASLFFFDPRLAHLSF